MKHYYAIEAFSERDVSFPEHLVALGRGVNVFTLTSEDIQGTLSQIAREGVRIDKVHSLDGLEPIPELTGAENSLLGE